MKKFALLGFPLGHSLSPQIHKELFAASGVEATYELMPIDLDSFAKMENLPSGFDGFNVTIPYKQQLGKLLSGLDSSAEECGAVNTIFGGVGFNTDVFGFEMSVEKLGASLSGRTLVLGWGGVSTMMARKAVCSGGRVVMAVRGCSVDKAQEQVKDWDIEVVDIGSICGKFDLLANGTPVGMSPNTGNSPVGPEVVKDCTFVFDTIYNPSQTKLLQFAQEQGIPHMNGLLMLVAQAAKAQEIWMGSKFDIKQLQEVCKKIGK